MFFYFVLFNKVRVGKLVELGTFDMNSKNCFKCSKRLTFGDRTDFIVEGSVD